MPFIYRQLLIAIDSHALLKDDNPALQDGASDFLDFADSCAAPVGLYIDRSETEVGPVLGALGVRLRLSCIIDPKAAAFLSTASPGFTRWSCIFNFLRGMMGWDFVIPIIIETRFAEAYEALKCHPDSIALIVLPGSTEAIPADLQDRLFVVKDLFAVRAHLLKIVQPCK